MLGQLLLQSVVILWLVQAAHTGGFPASSGIPNGQGPQPYGKKPQNGGGTGRMLMPSKGVGHAMGSQYSYGGYATKGTGYGARAGASNGQGGKQQAGSPYRHGAKSSAYGAQVGPTNGQQLKGYGVQAGATNGQQMKGNGFAAGFGTSNGKGEKTNGQRGPAHKPTGYGQPRYAAGVGASRGQGVLAGNHKTQAYGQNGYNAFGPQLVGGYAGRSSAGLGLGPQYGNGGMKRPKPVHAGTRAANGNGALHNGYGYPSGGATRSAKPGNGHIPNGYGNKHRGYGAIRGGEMTSQSGYGNGAVPSGYGKKPSGYGGPSGGSKPQTTKGVGAAPPSEGAGTLGTGYGTNGKSTKGVFNGKALKGGVLSPEQPSAAPETDVPPQHETTRGAAPAAPEPTSGILVMVTQGKYNKLPSPVPQGKSYKQKPVIPQATPEPAPAVPQEYNPKPAPEHAPEPPPLGPKVPLDPQTMPSPEQAAHLPQGYVTGSAVPEQKGAEADVLFGVDGASEGEAGLESTKPLKAKALPETVAATNTGSVAPEETLAAGAPEISPEEANIESQPEAGSDLGIKSLPSGQSGAAENRGEAQISKAQGAKQAKPDCGQSGVPNGQWMKIPRPGCGAGADVPNGNGYGASAGGYSNGGAAQANKPAYGAEGYTFPGYDTRYGAGHGYPYAAKPLQPGYGQGAYLGAGYGNGNSYGGNTGLGESGKSKSGYGNGYSAGVQPDYASLGQSAPPNGKSGMGSFALDSSPMGLGAEQPIAKYGIGGLLFGGQPASTGINGAAHNGYGINPYGPPGDGKSSGKYGGLGASLGRDPAPGKYGHVGLPYGGQLPGLGTNGNAASKYDYRGMPYEPQPAGLGPEAKSISQYGLAGSPYQPESHGFGQNVKLTDTYDTAGLPYESLPPEPDSARKSYVNGEVPTPAFEGEDMSMGTFDVGYINGQVQPEVVAFPAAVTPNPSLDYPSAPSYPPMESSFTADVVPAADVEDLPDPLGTAGLVPDSTQAPGREGVAEVQQRPDDTQQQLPRQIQIRQHLKLHFHPQGSKNGKHDLNGFFGNNGY